MATVLEGVDVGPGRLGVPVPAGWERLEPRPGLPLLAREGEGDRFRANVTVALDPAGHPRHAAEAADMLAGGLDSAVVVDAVDSVEGTVHKAFVVVAHSVGPLEVVVFQAQLRPGPTQVAVSYTTAVEDLRVWRALFEGFLQRLELTGGPPR